MPAGSRISRRDLRELLLSVLRTDSDQDAFTLDYFTDVYRRLASGMDRPQKLNILLETQEPDEILAALEQHAPKQVQKFLAQLSPPAPEQGQSNVPPQKPPAPSSAVPHVVCLHADKDREAYQELRLCLAPQLRAGAMTLWGPAEYRPGENTDSVRHAQVESASVVVLLVSSDLLADLQMDQAIARVLARRTAGQCIVVPVLVRAAAWQHSRFGSLQPLPRDGQPIRPRSDRDAAWVEVVEGLLQALRPRP